MQFEKPVDVSTKETVSTAAPESGNAENVEKAESNADIATSMINEAEEDITQCNKDDSSSCNEPVVDETTSENLDVTYTNINLKDPITENMKKKRRLIRTD